MEKVRKPRKPSLAQQLIQNLVDPSKFGEKNFWPREIKIANKLIKTYNKEFLLWVIPPYNKKVPSLCYFIATYGKEYLSVQSFNFQKNNLDISPKAVQYEMSEHKIGEDAVVTQKQPKSLKDFLKLF